MPSIVLKGKNLKEFPLKTRTRQGYVFASLSLHIVIKCLTREIKQEKEIKSIKIKKNI
jgi:hypothetical protein